MLLPAPVPASVSSGLHCSLFGRALLWACVIVLAGLPRALIRLLASLSAGGARVCGGSWRGRRGRRAPLGTADARCCGPAGSIMMHAPPPRGQERPLPAVQNGHFPAPRTGRRRSGPNSTELNSQQADAA